jgi:hypothetical protein
LKVSRRVPSGRLPFAKVCSGMRVQLADWAKAASRFWKALLTAVSWVTL